VGGRTSHAAIVSRELGIPAVVGIENLKLLKSMVGKILTIDGDSGLVFAKKLSLIKDSRDIDTRRLPKTRTRVGLILADVNQAFRFSQLAANEYKNQLIGGDLYEPDEDNPMLGNRGTGRYLMGTNLKYLGWELQALVLARTQFKAENLELMLPFVRTLAEASLALKYIKKTIKTKNLKIIAMSEIPSNALIATEFIKLFDGFSIGSNDMTQLVLGTDRDNQALQETYDEHDPAVVTTLLTTIFSGLKAGKKVGFCGQGVSDSVIIAGLVSIAGITSVSVVADRYLQTKELLAKLEKKKIPVKDLGQWLKQQFQARLKNGHKSEKDKIYATLNWDQVVLNSLHLGGFKSFDQAQKIIDSND